MNVSDSNPSETERVLAAWIDDRDRHKLERGVRRAISTTHPPERTNANSLPSEPGRGHMAAIPGGHARDATEVPVTGCQFFRANVGIAVLDSEGRVLALERYELPGAWQLPQGGLDEGEEPGDAAPRELREETSLAWNQIEVLGEHPRWLAYELDADMRKADTGRGQVQKWFVVRLVDQEAAIDIGRVDERKGHPEFRAYTWMSLADLLSNAPPFRLAAYEPLVDYIHSLTRG